MEDISPKCRLERNEQLGRYVVAADALKAGETFLLERPVVIVAANEDRRCANCLRLASNSCSCRIASLCENCPNHDAFECQRLAAIEGLPAGQHALVYGVLKCLLLNERAETAAGYAQILDMEAHLEQRRNTDIWRQHQEHVVQPLLNANVARYFPGHSSDAGRIDQELLQHICGVIDVNCFEIRAPEGTSMRGLYPRAAQLAHSCSANIVVAIDAQHQMKMYANRDIAAGEMLTICYTNVLLGSEERRELLQLTKHFHCECARCTDPTELNSHMSSLVCSPCAGANREGCIVLQPQQPGQKQRWQCLTCAHTLDAQWVRSILERAKEEIFHAKDDIYRYELLLAKLGRLLHRNHYLMVDLKQNAAAILRSIILNLGHRPGRKVYERKVRLCQELVAVLRIIQPGISRLKAIALYELSNTLAELGRMRYSELDLNSTQLQELLQHVELLLRESIRNLLYEPVDTPEGQMLRSMLKELKDLQNDIAHLQETAVITEIQEPTSEPKQTDETDATDATDQPVQTE